MTPRRPARGGALPLSLPLLGLGLVLALTFTGVPSLAAVAAEPFAPRQLASSVKPMMVRATTVATIPDSFSPDGRVTVHGSKTAGSAIAVTLASVNSRVCTIDADAQTTWSCTVLVPNGPQQRFTAVETLADSGAPAPASVDALIDVLGPPFLDGDGTVLTAGNLSGVGYPGSTVTVSVNGTPDPGCSRATVQASSFWSCAISAASGGPYSVRAQQSNAAIGAGSLSRYSNVQSVLVDREAPAAAVILAPTAGSRLIDITFVVSGAGESGAALDVYLDGTPSCSTGVTNSQFACTLGAPTSGEHTLRVIQRDAAGNYSPPSPEFSVSFGPAPVVAPVPGSVPSLPSPPAVTRAPAIITPSPLAPEVTPESTMPDTASPPTTGGTPEATSAVPLAGGWGAPTGFGRGATLLSTDPNRDNWLTGPLIGLLFLALVAIPLRLLVLALTGRVRLPHTQFMGRNQSVSPARDDSELVPEPRRPLRTAAIITATAVLIAISGGVAGEVRYLRLFLAITLGLIVLNGLTAVILRAGSRLLGSSITLRILPGMLLAAAITSVLSRVLSIDPPLITGVLVGAVFAATSTARKSAVLSLLQLAALTVLGTSAWLAHGLVSAGTGFWAALASETLATICLAGLGSVLVLVLPIASLPGRVILNWSSIGWTATVLVVVSLSAGVIFGSTAIALAATPAVFAVVAFAGLCVATWGFVRFVEPQLRA